eukprot:GHVS01073695.1.p1 GENE.GHVS01073695.1~~GHVS01073695.1.p1  ORF type:complete len:1142 (-),score=170.74 GHVS01073695.1:138-3455(-)
MLNAHQEMMEWSDMSQKVVLTNHSLEGDAGNWMKATFGIELVAVHDMKKELCPASEGSNKPLKGFKATKGARRAVRTGRENEQPLIKAQDFYFVSVEDNMRKRSLFSYLPLHKKKPISDEECREMVFRLGEILAAAALGKEAQEGGAEIVTASTNAKELLGKYKNNKLVDPVDGTWTNIQSKNVTLSPVLLVLTERGDVGKRATEYAKNILAIRNIRCNQPVGGIEAPYMKVHMGSKLLITTFENTLTAAMSTFDDDTPEGVLDRHEPGMKDVQAAVFAVVFDRELVSEGMPVVIVTHSKINKLLVAYIRRVFDVTETKDTAMNVALGVVDPYMAETGLQAIHIPKGTPRTNHQIPNDVFVVSSLDVLSDGRESRSAVLLRVLELAAQAAVLPTTVHIVGSMPDDLAGKSFNGDISFNHDSGYDIKTLNTKLAANRKLKSVNADDLYLQKNSDLLTLRPCLLRSLAETDLSMVTPAEMRLIMKKAAKQLPKVIPAFKVAVHESKVMAKGRPFDITVTGETVELLMYHADLGVDVDTDLHSLGDRAQQGVQIAHFFSRQMSPDMPVVVVTNRSLLNDEYREWMADTFGLALNQLQQLKSVNTFFEALAPSSSVGPVSRSLCYPESRRGDMLAWRAAPDEEMKVAQSLFLKTQQIGRNVVFVSVRDNMRETVEGESSSSVNKQNNPITSLDVNAVMLRLCQLLTVYGTKSVQGAEATITIVGNVEEHLLGKTADGKSVVFGSGKRGGTNIVDVNKYITGDVNEVTHRNVSWLLSNAAVTLFPVLLELGDFSSVALAIRQEEKEREYAKNILALRSILFQGPVKAHEQYAFDVYQGSKMLVIDIDEVVSLSKRVKEDNIDIALLQDALRRLVVDDKLLSEHMPLVFVTKTADFSVEFIEQLFNVGKGSAVQRTLSNLSISSLDQAVDLFETQEDFIPVWKIPKRTQTEGPAPMKLPRDVLFLSLSTNTTPQNSGVSCELARSMSARLMRVVEVVTQVAVLPTTIHFVGNTNVALAGKKNDDILFHKALGFTLTRLISKLQGNFKQDDLYIYRNAKHLKLMPAVWGKQQAGGVVSVETLAANLKAIGSKPFEETAASKNDAFNTFTIVP